MAFDHNLRRYRCCCGCCHVIDAVLAIGCLETMVLLIDVSGMVYAYLHRDEWRNSLWADQRSSHSFRYYNAFFEQQPLCFVVVGVLFAALGFAVVLIMFAGVWSRQWRLFLPHLFYQLMVVALLIVAVVLIVVGMASPDFDRSKIADDQNLVVIEAEAPGIPRAPNFYHDGRGQRSSHLSILLAVLGALLVGVSFEIYFFTVCLRCCRYLNDWRRYAQSSPAIAISHSKSDCALIAEMTLLPDVVSQAGDA